jgi:hypothetical protein
LALRSSLEKALDGVLKKAAVGFVIGGTLITSPLGENAFGAAIAAIQTYNHPCFHFALISLNTL